MASFDEKVEALRRLRDRRVAREQRSQEAEKDAQETPSTGDAGYPVQKAPCPKTVVQGLEGRELPDVLEHFESTLLQGEQEPAGQACESSDSNDAGASQDEADACYCLGHCYEQGIHECEQDAGKAATYYEMAAKKGSIVGQWRLGHLYEYGQGVKQSDATAASWYRFAADAGHAEAQSSLAILLEDGRADALDDGEALRWHLAAADQGNALSQYCAACCLAKGQGAEKDEKGARALLEKSAAAGFPLAVDALSKGGSWTVAAESGETFGSDAEETVGNSLLDLAARVARQIEHLPDADAEAFLDDLLRSVDDPSALGAGDLEDMLAGGELDLDLLMPSALPAPCAAAA